MSEPMEIVEIDGYDEPALAAWHAAYAAADRCGREATASPWQLPEVRVELQARSRRRWQRAWAGTVSGEVVCVGQASGPMLDNLEMMELEVHTVPERRRRGHGSAMLVHLEAVARQQGRSLLTTEAAWPLGADVNGAGEENVDFLTRRGFAVGLVDIQREVALPVADELLDRLAAAAAPHHAAYSLRSWVGPVPEELVQGWAEVSSSLMTEAPMGDLEREPETADPALVREGEERLAAMGRRRHCTVALDPDGAVAAYTDIATSDHEPGKGFQWGTLVRRDHRGHRLGLAVKVANLRALQAREPDITRVVTYNAEVNSHMIGVNEALGFRPVERLGELQKRL